MPYVVPEVTLQADNVIYSPERFWAKVDKHGPLPERRPDLGPCWLWTGATLDSGYGYFQIGYPGPRRNIRAHRHAFEQQVGPIPEGLEPDHLCRVRRCVNQAHIEIVTHRVNDLRGVGVSAINSVKTHCAHGHALVDGNLYIEVNSSGRHRICRACKLRRERDRRERAA